MLKQQQLIDVQGWEPDPQFAIFPQGARAKDAVFSPDIAPEPCLTPKKRYLFKKSKKSYPDQYWGEVVAYRIGCAIGVEVPPAFAAWNSETGVCAALIEWFYVDAEEISINAGDLLNLIQPNFERRTGATHNLRDATVLMRGLLGSRAIDRMGTPWRQWWANALFFDALIGNTDRHQDNWVILFKRHAEPELPKRIRLGPCFDNGTSLGHERFADRVAGWDAAAFERYVNKGTHHVKWSMDEPIQGHLDLLHRVVTEWPETRQHCCEMAEALNIAQLNSVLCDLPHLQCATPLTQQRYNFILKLLSHRMNRLKTLLLT